MPGDFIAAPPYRGDIGIAGRAHRVRAHPPDGRILDNVQSHCWLTLIVSVLAVAQCVAGVPFGERDRQPHGRDWRASIGVCLPVSGPSLGARSVESDGLAAAALSRARQLRLHLLDSAFDIRLLPVPGPRRDRSGTLPLASRPPPLV